MFNKKSLLLITALCIHAPCTLLMAANSASQKELHKKNDAQKTDLSYAEQRLFLDLALLYPIKSTQPITHVKTSMELTEKCVDSAPDTAPNQTES